MEAGVLRHRVREVELALANLDGEAKQQTAVTAAEVMRIGAKLMLAGLAMTDEPEVDRRLGKLVRANERTV